MRRPRRGRPDDTRARLVAAAAAVFNRDGYHGTDSNRLARAAGYAPGTFYKHFPDKRAAFVAVYEQWVTAEWDAVGTAVAGTGDVVGRIVAHVLAFHRRWRGVRASLQALVRTDAVVRAAYRRQRRRQLAMLRTLRERHGFAPRSAEEDAVLLYALERTCDALADGEVTALGLRRAAVTAILRRLVAEHVGRRPGRPPARRFDAACR
jgi:AcrR family transcriptional regulator